MSTDLKGLIERSELSFWVEDRPSRSLVVSYAHILKVEVLQLH